jgi:hypothetical protein
MTAPTPEQIALLGKEVLVQNPRIPGATWTGKAIGIVTQPSIIIEQADGVRMTLPIEWAHQVWADPPGESLREKLAMAVATMDGSVRKIEPYEGAGGNVEATVNARLAYDANHQAPDLARTWIELENQLTTPEYTAYQRLYRERRRA